MELYIKNPKNCQLIRKIKLTARLLKNNLFRKKEQIFVDSKEKFSPKSGKKISFPLIPPTRRSFKFLTKLGRSWSGAIRIAIDGLRIGICHGYLAPAISADKS